MENILHVRNYLNTMKEQNGMLDIKLTVAVNGGLLLRF